VGHVKRKAPEWYDDGGTDPDWAAIIGRPAKSARGYTEPVGFYGQVAEVEPLDADREDWVVQLDCFAADWFDALAADLHDMPDWHTAAVPSRARVVEFELPGERLAQVFSAALGPVTDAGAIEGSWVRLWLQLDTRVREGMPVRVFLPPDGSHDMTRAGSDGREDEGVHITGLDAPDPAAAAKLGLLAA
jgi:hypothetical protein